MAVVPIRWVDRWRANFRSVFSACNPDLVFVHCPDAFSIPVADIQGRPLVIATWGAEIIRMVPESEVDRASKVALLRSADAIIASSDFLAEATREYAGLERERVRRVYWGVDLDQFSPTENRVEHPVLGFAKSFLPKYGAQYLIEALPQILESFPRARVLMLGTGPEELVLRNLAARLNVAETLDWIGLVDYSRMPEYYARMAISVMPSTHDSETLGVAGR